MYNLNKEKIIIFSLTIPLGLLSLFLLLFGPSLIARGADDKNQTGRYHTETIYERRDCADGTCHDAGKKMISFKGPDAECESYMSEDERMKCYFNNSQASFSCPNLEKKGEVEDCFEKYRGPVFNYFQGGAGSLITTKSFTTGGSRMYFDGFDCNGEHKIKTGTDEPTNNAITFYEGSRDVHYGGDLDVRGDIAIQSSQGGAYFGSNVEYGEKDLGNGLRGQGLVKYDNFNGMNLNRCLDMKVLANHHQLLTIPGEERETFGAVEVEKGLEVNGDLKADFMYFQGRFLRWSQPIRGHFILYYNTPAEAPTTCDRPGYPRDIQPITTPSLIGPGESGENNVPEGGTGQ